MASTGDDASPPPDAARLLELSDERDQWERLALNWMRSAWRRRIPGRPRRRIQDRLRAGRPRMEDHRSRDDPPRRADVRRTGQAPLPAGRPPVMDSRQRPRGSGVTGYLRQGLRRRWRPRRRRDAFARRAQRPVTRRAVDRAGLCQKARQAYGSRLRYVPIWNQWLIWDGRRWAADMTGAVCRCMKLIARGLTYDAMSQPDEAKRKALISLARRAESAAGIRAALTLAGTEKGIVVVPGDLDADPFLLNCANGTLDLRTMELRGHDPADLITKITGAAYDPGAGRLSVHRVPRARPARPGDARLPGPAHRPRA